MTLSEISTPRWCWGLVANPFPHAPSDVILTPVLVRNRKKLRDTEKLKNVAPRSGSKKWRCETDHPPLDPDLLT